MKNLLASISIMAITFSSASGQTAPVKATTLIEKVVKKGSEIVIPYEKYELPNGLTLLIHEDHSDPIVHVDVTYHVGSAREEISKSGFAHFFEHMMFQGSENVGDEEHFKIISEAGGTLNGTTNTDRTNYFETLPSNQLEVALWLESDRMGFFLDSVTKRKFEIQRSTVKNERGQNYDNRPYGLMNEKISASLYPYGHPYSWLTIGYIEDLNRSTVEDLKKFFLRWYGPNNATLTVAGDVKPSEVIKLVEKYFGSIPRGPEVKGMQKTKLTLDKDRYISYEDNIRFPMLVFSYPTVPSRDADEPALDILADILGGGKNSILYKNLVKTQKANMANAQHPTAELAGTFNFYVRTFPDKGLAEMEEQIRLSIAEFEKRGVNDDDLKRFKASFESSTINSLASVSGKASQLASSQTFTGNPNQLKATLDSYMKVTKEDVIRVYNQYIKGKSAVILSIYPKGKYDVKARNDDYAPTMDGEITNKTDYSKLVYNKGKDTFDRSKQPIPGPAPLVSVPDYWTENFDNGLKIIGAINSEIPSVSMQLAIEAGHKTQQSDLSKAGLASLVSAMMNESTLKYSAEAFESELDKLGSSISVSSSSEHITVNISSLVKNIDATLALAQERIFSPKFDQEDFDRLKKQQLENIANQSTQPTVIANNIYAQLLYGTNNILSVPSIGTKASVESIQLDDVKKYYEKYFSPSIANLVIVGDVSKEKILPKIDFFKKWAAKRVELVALPTKNPVIEKTKIYLVDKDKAPQSEFRIGYLSMPFDATGDFYKSGLMNYPLGGAFNSRINLNLRENKGYTYGARSFYSGDKTIGTYTASAGIRADATDSALVEFMKEIKLYADNGISDEELRFTKNSIGQRDALKYETPFQKIGFLRPILAYNLDKNFVEKQSAILNSITKDEVNALAKKHLPYNNMNIVIVGDTKNVKEGLSKLGYEMVNMDSEGKVVK